MAGGRRVGTLSIMEFFTVLLEKKTQTLLMNLTSRNILSLLAMVLSHSFSVPKTFMKLKRMRREKSRNSTLPLTPTQLEMVGSKLFWLAIMLSLLITLNFRKNLE